MRQWSAFCRLGGVGDNLIAASVARPLKNLGYMVEAITTAKDTHTVFLNNPFIDKITLKDDGDIPGGADWQKWFAGRAKEYSVFANLSHSCEYRHALFPDQTQFWWPQDYRRNLCGGSYLETVHDIMGVPHTFGPLFFPTEEERERAEKTRDEQIGGPYLAWAISGSRIDKIYPAAPIVISRIIKELGIPVVMIGVGGKQFEMAKQIADFVEAHNSSSKGIHLALSPDNADAGGHQHWSIRRSLTQAVTADLVVTPDTGIWWAAAFEAMPKILMLSHASESNIAAHAVNATVLHADANRVPCWPCHRLHSSPDTCRQNKDGNGAACISDISVETMLSTVEKLWRKRNGNVVPLRGVAA